MMQNIEAMQKQSQESMELAVQAMTAVSKGMQDIAKEVADFSKQQFEVSSAAAEKLMASKSIDKVFEVQAEYAKTSYEAFVAQATKMSEMYAGLAKEAYKPFEAFSAKAA